jgi:hypothetical protein
MASSPLVFMMVLSCMAACVQGLNITTVLASYSQFGLFNEWLLKTGVANEINSRTDVTILVTTNSTWQAYLSGVPGSSSQPELVADTLRYQVLLGYYSLLELQKISVNNFTSVTTLLQTSGRTNDTAGTGFVDIYNTGTQFVLGHLHPDNYGNQSVVANITESLFEYSVLQISSVLIPLPTLAPSPLPSPTLTPAPSSGLAPGNSRPAPAIPAATGPTGTTPDAPNHASTTNVRISFTLVVFFLVSMTLLL